MLRESAEYVLGGALEDVSRAFGCAWCVILAPCGEVRFKGHIHITLEDVRGDTDCDVRKGHSHYEMVGCVVNGCALYVCALQRKSPPP